MRLDRVQVLGYKRLAPANVYVGRKTLALVGPNEAGKSSVLEILAYFNSDNEVPAAQRSRTIDQDSINPQTEDIAVIWFELTAAQLEKIANVPLAEVPRHIRYHKRYSGKVFYSLDPAPELRSSLKADLAKSWPSLARYLKKRVDLSGVFVEAEDAEDGVELTDDGLLEVMNLYLSGGDTLPTRDVLLRLVELADTAGRERDIPKASETAVEQVREFVRWHAEVEDLQAEVGRLIAAERPKVEVFAPSLRVLKDAYDLSNSNDLEDPVLVSLLRLASTEPQAFADLIDDPSRRQTLKVRTNEALRSFFLQAWNQAELTVEINLEDSVLKVFVTDLTGDVNSVKITDRSDGLRMFVCLAAFLAKAASSGPPPILLIDEADLHLHLNAQADLVRLLQDAEQVSQVIYTTHSPGCLPTDLGSGVRFVQPDKDGKEKSLIRHDFWTLQDSSAVGLSPLLLVMGAGSAAFASLRSAIIAEGPADMLLLPLLVRLATGAAELPYQVAPGVSAASIDVMRNLDFAASRVGYVVDGDDAGIKWKKDLEAAGVESVRIHKWPGASALEDLLDRSFYLDSIEDFLGQEIDRSALGTGLIKTEVEKWVKVRRLKPVGPVAVAEMILGKHESGERPVQLSAKGRRYLGDFDEWARATVVAK